MENLNFKFLEHTADKKFQAFGNSLEECFINAALALKSVFYEKEVKSTIEKQINIKGTDLENLMVNFLEELLVLFETEEFLLSSISYLSISSTGGLKRKSFKLFAVLHGDSAKNYKIEGSVKAITYYDIFVKKEKDKYICQVVVDV
ncbi:MAG: archease [Candidatus Pacearchaeota archaeon]